VQRRTQVLGIGIAAVMGAAALGVGSVGAAPSGEIVAKGKPRFVPNRLVLSNQRFSPDIRYTTSGATLTLRNADGNGEPHTFTLATIAQRPNTINEVFDCGFCNDIGAKHFPANGAPVPVLNEGQPGLDKPGDSYFVEAGRSVQATVSAPAGTNLYFVCIIHPWMQARINVR